MIVKKNYLLLLTRRCWFDNKRLQQLINYRDQNCKQILISPAHPKEESMQSLANGQKKKSAVTGKSNKSHNKVVANSGKN